MPADTRGPARFLQTRFVLGVVVAGAIGVYAGRHAGAIGVPTTNTLTYSGTLLTFGLPDNSSHNMSAVLLVGGTVACTQTTQSVTVVNGQFSLPLSSTCEAVILANPAASVQVTIDGTPMPATPLTAVPYAIEAASVDMSGVTGVLPVANGGTGSPTQNFVLQNSATGAATLPSGATAQRPSSPTAGFIRFNTTTAALEFFDGTNWQSLSSAFAATGGTVTNSGGYEIHTFTSSGTFQVTTGSRTAEILIVAGGGAGGFDVGGGGGAGGVIWLPAYTLSVGSYTVTVGAGGTPAMGDAPAASPGNGASSAFASLTAIGGGGGGNYIGQSGNSGGSGGGAAGYSQNDGQIPGAGTASQGYAGGLVSGPFTSSQTGSGGGGAGGVGQNSVQNITGTTPGGPGVTYTTSGSAVTYAAGGAGGGDSWTGNTTAATANTGNGGSGAGNSAPVNGNDGCAGGSGIVILKYLP